MKKFNISMFKELDEFELTRIEDEMSKSIFKSVRKTEIIDMLNDYDIKTYDAFCVIEGKTLVCPMRINEKDYEKVEEWSKNFNLNIYKWNLGCSNDSVFERKPKIIQRGL